MATRAPQISPNRQGGYGSGGPAAGSVDVGAAAVTQMAREDARWFAIIVVIMSLVLFLALPFSLLILVEAEKIKAEVKYEIRQMKKLQAQLKPKKEQENE